VKATRAEAVKLVALRMLAAAGTIYGAQPYHVERLREMAADPETSGGLNIRIEWERAWSVGCDLSVRIGSRHTDHDVKVVWSSTGRTPAEAVAAAALYAQVAALACEIESLLSRIEVES